MSSTDSDLDLDLGNDNYAAEDTPSPGNRRHRCGARAWLMSSAAVVFVIAVVLVGFRFGFAAIASSERKNAAAIIASSATADSAAAARAGGAKSGKTPTCIGDGESCSLGSGLSCCPGLSCGQFTGGGIFVCGK